MSFNTFGRMFRFTTWGESHGEAIGVVVDGCPPNIPLEPTMLQKWMDKRKPGKNRYTSQRREADEVDIVSGVFEGRTTGTPIQILIRNTDHRSKDYDEIKEKFRPGHADITYWQKYGIRDYRGSGRASARETASRVAAGGVAREVINCLAPGAAIKGSMIQMGSHRIDSGEFDEDEIDRNEFWCPSKESASAWAGVLDKARKSGDSLGAIIEIRANGVPPGLGAPVYGKLDADLAAGMMSINAVKGVEIGAGMRSAELAGSENADEIECSDGTISFNSNNAGGVLGGISTGQEIVVRFAVKPTSSILTPKRTIRKDGATTDIRTKGRHDPCVGIRAVPVGEAMTACVIADHLLMDRAQTGGNRGRIGS